MLFNFGLLSSFLLASAVLAHPPPQLSKRDDTSGRWGGIEVEGEANDTFTTVSATIRTSGINPVDTPFDVIIGLDGIQCPDAYVQVGIEIKNDEYKAWYLWHPGTKQYFDISISPEDDINVNIVAVTENYAIVEVENLATQDIAGMTLPSPYAICRRDVMLVVAPQDPHHPIDNFGTVEFVDPYDYDNDNTNQSSTIHLVDLVQNGMTTVQTSFELGGDVAVRYV